MKGKSKSKVNEEKAAINYDSGYRLVLSHPIIGSVARSLLFERNPSGNPVPKHGYAIAYSTGRVFVHPTRMAAPEEWAYVLGHCTLHYAFGHFTQKMQQEVWTTACDLFVANFLKEIGFGSAPYEVPEDILSSILCKSEEKLFERLLRDGIPAEWKKFSVGGGLPDMVFKQKDDSLKENQKSWSRHFADGLTEAVEDAVWLASIRGAEDNVPNNRTPAQRARQWFVGDFPLFAALATSFKIVEDPALCRRLDVSIAAVDAELREIYINPAAGLTELEARFVIAHEFLHVGLRHHMRCLGRDPYLWNVACDLVINGWLVEMKVGEIPSLGVLHDPSLAGLSAEEIYGRIVTEGRRSKKLATLRGGCDCGDMLEPRKKDWWRSGDGIALDEFYRRALAQGLSMHEAQNRGLLPSGLVEEINALEQPPIPWDVQLARWFDHHFPPLEKQRSYARISRRQSATPSIPRPASVVNIPDEKRTFAVVLDTSGSMDRQLLAKALGAIASYSLSRDVELVRVIFCDAATYDQGYMAPAEIAGRVRVKGRGGTVLQPAIDLLERTLDFPKTGPILIITDGYCDVLSIRRDHAFLIPAHSSLPFTARGEVFRMS